MGANVAGYGPSSIKGGSRRTKAEIEALKNAICSVVEQNQPMTVRQVFYRLVAMCAVDKTETEYNDAVGRLPTEMRRDRKLPYLWIADNTRWISVSRAPLTRSSRPWLPRPRCTGAPSGATCRYTSSCGARRTLWPACCTGDVRRLRRTADGDARLCD
jgi:hypothetical protein